MTCRKLRDSELSQSVDTFAVYTLSLILLNNLKFIKPNIAVHVNLFYIVILAHNGQVLHVLAEFQRLQQRLDQRAKYSKMIFAAHLDPKLFVV